MSEKLYEHPNIKNKENPEKQELDFEGEILGKEKIVSNSELGVTYKEKIIELPEYRQKETGIKRIKRRELIPPFPDGFFISHEEAKNEYIGKLPKSWSKSMIEEEEKRCSEINMVYFSLKKKFDKVYEFITDKKYPAPDSWVHGVLIGGVSDSARFSKKRRKVLERFKRENLYFSEITVVPGERVERNTAQFYKKDSNGNFIEDNDFRERKEMQYGYFSLQCTPKRMFLNEFATPVFVFSKSNKTFRSYIESILNHPDRDKFMLSGLNNHKERLEELIGMRPFDTERYDEEVIPCVKHPDIKPLRWCNAELGLVPTKKSLNVLFFESK